VNYVDGHVMKIFCFVIYWLYCTSK